MNRLFLNSLLILSMASVAVLANEKPPLGEAVGIVFATCLPKESSFRSPEGKPITIYQNEVTFHVAEPIGFLYKATGQLNESQKTLSIRYTLNAQQPERSFVRLTFFLDPARSFTEEGIRLVPASRTTHSTGTLSDRTKDFKCVMNGPRD